MESELRAIGQGVAGYALAQSLMALLVRRGILTAGEVQTLIEEIAAGQDRGGPPHQSAARDLRRIADAYRTGIPRDRS